MVGLIDEGVKSFRRERERFWAEPGSISIVNPGDLHTGERAEGAVLRYRALYLPVPILAAVVSPGQYEGAPGFRSGVLHDALLSRSLGALHAAIVEGTNALKLEETLAAAVHCLVARHAGLPPQHDAAARDAPHAVSRARALLRARYREDLAVSDIAAIVGLSPFHLMRQFRRHVGLPMHAYQTQLRVEEAKRLLKGGMPVVEAGLAVGFADQSHFTKRFKERVGAPPGAYARTG